MGITLSDILKMNAKKYPNRDAILFEGKTATYRQLNERVNQRANALLALGVMKGDHVATFSHNSLALIESIFAVLRIGSVLVPLNVRLSPQELSHILNHSDAKMILFSAAFEDTIRKIAPTIQNAVRLISFGRKHSSEFIDFDARALEQSTESPTVEIHEGDTATILYTAGTTGKPKGVVASHENWIWSCINCIVALRLTPQLKSLITYPLFHVAAFLNLFSILFSGSSLLILEEFEPRHVLELVEKEKISRLGNPPTVYNMILQVPDIAKYDLSSVRYINFGAEIMPEETRRRLQKAFPRAGLFDNYGLTETCSLVSSRSEEYTEKPYSVGIPVLSAELRVADEKGKEVPAGEVGEIVVRGPNIMVGYYKDSEKTGEAIRDGWLHTEDLGRFDEEGFLYIVERKHHMIISGGENIYPKEVEDVLCRHPKILEVAVFGVPDKTWGHKVCAAVVLKRGEQMTPEEVIGFCKENLASFKKPKSVMFVETLPRNPQQKVLRSELKTKHMGQLA